MQWVVVIGEEYSGRDLVSLILGGHKHVRFAYEEKYFSRWHRGVIDPKQIVPTLLEVGYNRSSKVMDHWPSLRSHTDPLLCVGDNCVDDVVRLVRLGQAPPGVLHEFSNAIGLPVKVVHTVRNPTQTIATLVNDPKYFRLWGDQLNRRAQIAIRRYAKFYQAAQSIFDHHDSVFHLQYEALIYKPTDTLMSLFKYLDLPQDKSYRRWAIQKKLPKKISMLEETWSRECERAIQGYVLNAFNCLRFEYGQ